MGFAAATERSGSESALDRRVLIIDDDRDFAEAMADALNLHGFSVAFAQSADTALPAVEKFRPAALLVDARLGQTSGLDLIPEIKERLPDAICVIVTAYPDIDSAIGALRIQADDYLQKPVQPEEVSKVLDYYLQRAEAVNGKERTEIPGGVNLGSPRDNSFGRLLVHRFSHLFSDPATPSTHRGPIPRRVLPGFFAAVDMMLGAERVEKNQQKCRDAIVELGQRESLSGAKAWNAFYADERASDIALESEMLMAAHFKDFDRCAKWLTSVIHNSGPTASVSTDEQSASWPPTEKAVMMMLSAIFSDLRTATSDERTRRRIAQKFGERETQLFAEVANEAQRRSGVN